jgi:hypothetical protein
MQTKEQISNNIAFSIKMRINTIPFFEMTKCRRFPVQHQYVVSKKQLSQVGYDKPESGNISKKVDGYSLAGSLNHGAEVIN